MRVVAIALRKFTRRGASLRSRRATIYAGFGVSYVLHADLVHVCCDGDCDRCGTDEDEVDQTLREYQNVVDLFALMRHRGTLLWAVHAMLSHVPERHRKGACELHEFYERDASKRLRPVIWAGIGSPMRFSNVGATSPSLPPSAKLPCKPLAMRINGTGLVVCAVRGLFCSSSFVSALP